MRLIITNYSLRGAKMGEDVFLEKFNNHFVVIGLSKHIFYPFRDVIHWNQDEPVTKRIWEWSHEVNTPNIKKFQLQESGLGASCLVLKFSQSFDNLHMIYKVECVFEQSGPVKPTL